MKARRELCLANSRIRQRLEAFYMLVSCRRLKDLETELRAGGSAALTKLPYGQPVDRGGGGVRAANGGYYEPV